MVAFGYFWSFLVTLLVSLLLLVIFTSCLVAAATPSHLFGLCLACRLSSSSLGAVRGTLCISSRPSTNTLRLVPFSLSNFSASTFGFHQSIARSLAPSSVLLVSPQPSFNALTPFVRSYAVCSFADLHARRFLASQSGLKLPQPTLAPRSAIRNPSCISRSLQPSLVTARLTRHSTKASSRQRKKTASNAQIYSRTRHIIPFVSTTSC